MNDEIKYYHLKNLSFSSALSEAQLKTLSTTAKLKVLHRGERIYFESPTKIYILLKGKLKLMNIEDIEKRIMKDILLAGEFFGDLSLNDHSLCEEYAEALLPNTLICYFDVSEFKKLLEATPSLALNYAKGVGNKLRQFEQRHASLALKDAKYRLIQFFKIWARMDGVKDGDRILLQKYLTHTDIADFISTSRQSVHTLLKELKQSGLIYYNRKYFELHDPTIWN